MRGAHFGNNGKAVFLLIHLAQIAAGFHHLMVGTVHFLDAAGQKQHGPHKPFGVSLGRRFGRAVCLHGGQGKVRCGALVFCPQFFFKLCRHCLQSGQVFCGQCCQRPAAASKRHAECTAAHIGQPKPQPQCPGKKTRQQHIGAATPFMNVLARVASGQPLQFDLHTAPAAGHFGLRGRQCKFHAAAAAAAHNDLVFHRVIQIDHTPRMKPVALRRLGSGKVILLSRREQHFQLRMRHILGQRRHSQRHAQAVVCPQSGFSARCQQVALPHNGHRVTVKVLLHTGGLFAYHIYMRLQQDRRLLFIPGACRAAQIHFQLLSAHTFQPLCLAPAKQIIAQRLFVVAGVGVFAYFQKVLQHRVVFQFLQAVFGFLRHVCFLRVR